MKFSFFHLFSFRVDKARVFQRVSLNFNMTVGQVACRLLRRYTQFNARWLRPVSAETYRLLRVNQVKDLVTVRV